MTDANSASAPKALTDYSWWNETIGQLVRTIWHFVGFYAALAPPIEQLTVVSVVGTTYQMEPVSLPTAITIPAAGLFAVGLSVVKPTVSSARTLAFGFIAAILFAIIEAILGLPMIAGRLIVILDVFFAAVAALAVAAVIAYGFDGSALTKREADS